MKFARTSSTLFAIQGVRILRSTVLSSSLIISFIALIVANVSVFLIYVNFMGVFNGNSFDDTNLRMCFY